MSGLRDRSHGRRGACGHDAPAVRLYASGIPACRDPRPAESVHPTPVKETDMVNRVILIGNLTKDAESLPSSGKPMTRMRLATNSTWRDTQGNRQEETEYHAVICFGRLAEVCALYCTRGRRVYVEGKLRTRDYTGGDGLRRFSTEVVAESVKLLSARRSSEDLATEESDESASVELPVAS
jgi:single-strand DNA-binding protein